MLLQAHSRLKAAFGLEIAMIVMFSYPNVRSMEQHLSEGEAGPVEDLRTRGIERRERLERRRK